MSFAFSVGVEISFCDRNGNTNMLSGLLFLFPSIPSSENVECEQRQRENKKINFLFISAQINFRQNIFFKNFFSSCDWYILYAWADGGGQLIEWKRKRENQIWNITFESENISVKHLNKDGDERNVQKKKKNDFNNYWKIFLRVFFLLLLFALCMHAYVKYVAFKAK